MINPFENNIVDESQILKGIEQGISSLNDHALNTIIEQFERLDGKSEPCERKLTHAQFVVSPAPGYGKSHLIGRLFKELSQKATLIYITPLGNVIWQSLLHRIVQELRLPDKIDGKHDKKKNHRQLEAFTLSILEKLILYGVKGKLIKKEDIPISSSELKNIPYEKSEKSKKLLDWVKENIKTLEDIFYEQIDEHKISLSDSPSNWLRVLFTYTYYTGNRSVRQNCTDWLIGGKFDQDEAKKIGVKISDTITASDGINELCKSRIKDFCQLALFFRPFVFCIDQTEVYRENETRVISLGTLIQELTDSFYNQMTVVTAIRPIWEDKINLHE
ncbi:hypothetical protein [Candidatus Magnetobacterium casense]|uniref:Uncharacterized protein n=1 Tax=Candidatus Magnetobacterium casense TaxID=1455061 RepID=A0ABS6S1W2_9BACT|nr:hypothetical protein [Candidatus Magnetobacterium casensis]MBV6342595.1 hypothetical protein [Candidatus Magnetobacterium casensis]